MIEMVNVKRIRFLLVMGLIISAIALTADTLSDYIGPLEYQGQIGFAYSEGENPIVSVVFDIDQEISENLKILSTPPSWSYSYDGKQLVLSDGSLSPGNSLYVAVSMKKYVPPGEYPIYATGTTSAGETSQATGSLQVTLMLLLYVFFLMSTWKLPLVITTVGIGALDFYYMRRIRTPPMVYEKPDVTDLGTADEGQIPDPLAWGKSYSYVDDCLRSYSQKTGQPEIYEKPDVTDLGTADEGQIPDPLAWGKSYSYVDDCLRSYSQKTGQPEIIEKPKIDGDKKIKGKGPKKDNAEQA